MHEHTANNPVDEPPPKPWWKSRSGPVLCGFMLVAGFYLLTEHTAHTFGVLPFLLIATCPLLHLFHHHGHGEHHGQAASRTVGPEAASSDDQHYGGPS
jgi:hypothetical protein